MATQTATETHRATSAWSRIGLRGWVLAALTLKLLDGTLTFLGLQAGFVELNPVWSTLIVHLGDVLGILLSISLGVLAVVVASEGTRAIFSRWSRTQPYRWLIRPIFFGSAIATSMIAVAWNTALLGGVIP